MNTPTFHTSHSSILYSLTALTTAFLLLIPPALAQDATFQGLGDLDGGDFYSEASDVSADGSVVVGHSISTNGEEAFRWENGEMESLGYLPEPGDSPFSRARGVSSDGSIVVGESSVDGGVEAFRWEDGEMEGLGFLPGGDFSSARAVSPDGSVVVGYSFSENGIEAFRWEDGEMEGLGDLPGGSFGSAAWGVSENGAVVIGAGNTNEGQEAFRWEAGEMEGLGTLPSDSYFSVANDITADGSVVVGQTSSVIDGQTGVEAFRWEDGEMEGLGTAGSQALGISADGSVMVGFGSTPSSGDVAFMWTEAEGGRNLKEVLEEDYDLDLERWDLLWNAWDVSADGTVIVGHGVHPDGNIEAWRAEAPFAVADEATPEALADVLGAPSPNPASGTSTFTIAVERGQHVSVEVFDTMGRRVQTVYEGNLAAGMSETLTLDASALPAGVYIIRATGEDFFRTRRVTVVQ